MTENNLWRIPRENSTVPVLLVLFSHYYQLRHNHVIVTIWYFQAGPLNGNTPRDSLNCRTACLAGHRKIQAAAVHLDCSGLLE